MGMVGRRHIIVRGGAVAAIAAVSTWRSSGAQAALDLATAYPIGNFHVQNLQQWADELAARADARLQVRVHAGGSLVKAPEIRAAVQSGRVALGEVFGPSLAGLDGVFGLDAVPFLATNYGSARRLWTTVQSRCATVLREQGLVLLMSVPWPPQGLFSVAPLASSTDLRGLRMRENSPPVKRLAELAGATAVRVETPDLALAAAERKVDLVFTSAAQGLDTQLFETLPYYYETNAWLPRNLVFMHRGAYERLSAAQRQSLDALTAQAHERGWAMSQAFARSTTETLARQRGVKTSQPPVALRSALERMGNQIATEMLRTSGSDLLTLTASYLK
jgi:TRAP-type C4-dicarboxylate transport system substrate-binding protein